MAVLTDTTSKQISKLLQGIKYFHSYPTAISYGRDNTYVNKKEALRDLRRIIPKYRLMNDQELIDHLHDTWVNGRGPDVNLLHNLVQQETGIGKNLAESPEQVAAPTPYHETMEPIDVSKESSLISQESRVSQDQVKKGFPSHPTELHKSTVPIDAIKELSSQVKEGPVTQEEVEKNFPKPEVVKAKSTNPTTAVSTANLPIRRLSKFQTPQFALNGFSKFKIWVGTTKFPFPTFLGAGIGAIGGFGIGGLFGAGLGAVGGGAIGKYLAEEGNPYRNYPIEEPTRQQRSGHTNTLLRRGAMKLAKTAGKEGVKKGLVALVAADPIAWLIIGAVLIVLGIIIILPIVFNLLKTTPLVMFSNTASYVSPYTGSGDLSCYTSMTADEINNYFSSNGYNNFIGTGDTFVSAAQQYKLNPALIISVGINESALGNAYKGTPTENLKNAFGIMGSNGLQSYGTWGDGARASFDSIAQYKCSSIDCIGSQYAPIGASNDPNHLNDNWVPNVTKSFSSIPQHPCYSAVAAAPDYPTGWPTTGTIITLPFKGMHAPNKENANGVDISTPQGTKVYATLNGIATHVSYSDFAPPGQGCDQSYTFEGYWGYGVFVMIKNQATGARAIYAHMIPGTDSMIKEGQLVTKGTLLGEVDDTGCSFGAHLHYQIADSLQYTDFGKFVPGGEPYQNEIISTVGNPGEWGPGTYTPLTQSPQSTPTP